MTPTGTVRHQAEGSRYEDVTSDGQVVGVADYDIAGDRVVMHHTHTEPSMRGQGIAAALVGGALDALRARGLQVVPTCWYVAQFIDEHPEYGDLLAA